MREAAAPQKSILNHPYSLLLIKLLFGHGLAFETAHFRKMNKRIAVFSKNAAITSMTIPRFSKIVFRALHPICLYLPCLAYILHRYI